MKSLFKGFVSIPDRLSLRGVTLGVSLLMASASALTQAAGEIVEGDPAAGEEKAAVCAGCHGPAGNSAAAMFPKLSGQVAKYIDLQLHLIKSNERLLPLIPSNQPGAAVSGFFLELNHFDDRAFFAPVLYDNLNRNALFQFFHV